MIHDVSQIDPPSPGLEPLPTDRPVASPSDPILFVGSKKRYMFRASEITRILPPLPNHQYCRLFTSFQQEPIEISKEDFQAIESAISLTQTAYVLIASPSATSEATRIEDKRESVVEPAEDSSEQEETEPTESR